MDRRVGGAAATEWLPSAERQNQLPRQIADGTLADVAKRITAGQYVENLSAGSMGKLAGFIEERRGLRAVQRWGQVDSR
jgi:hypothetical protein